MKKLIFVFLIFLLVGCSFIKTQRDAFEACMQDTVCYEKAKVWKGTGELVGSAGGSVIPGVAPVTSLVGGYVALGLAMVILGKGVLKKKNEQ